MTTISSNWPILRTNPADGSQTGVAPVLVGALGVLLVGPALGFVLAYLGNTISESTGPALQATGVLLALSPFVTWAVLIVAIPVSIVMARHGLAGWGMAMGCGGIAGVLCVWIMDGGLIFDSEALIFVAIGAALALCYWLAVRLICPSAIGVSVYRPTGRPEGS